MHSHDSHGGEPHGHSHDRGVEQRIGLTLALTVALMVAEFVGGWWTNSLALMADSGHMLSDAVALAATWWALRRSSVPPSPRRTFGERRAETLVALFNGATLLVVAGGILHESWGRLWEPEDLRAGPMLAIACAGLAVNVIGLGLLHGHRHSSLNLEGAWQHVAGDAAGSVCAIIAAVGVLLGGWRILDPVASVIVTVLIVFGAIRLLRRTIAVLMESAPASVDVLAVRRTLLDTPGVRDVHCLHVWTIATGFHALTAHIVFSTSDSSTGLLDRLHSRLGETFPVEHVTLQLEPEGYAGCRGDDGWCQIQGIP
jgi:cobalt-zinc-cadmium efflux system protein